MYEHITYEHLLRRMLEKVLSVNSNLDTREGSMVWLGNAPAAVELQNLYIQLDTILRETFADTASREYLILRAAERGLAPYPASPAVLELSITPIDLALPMGSRFSIGDYNYFVSADRENGRYEITCETAGESGNEYNSLVIPIEYIKGLETCKVTALLIPGEDEEDTEAFRQRYFDSLAAQAFGGNRADYMQKVGAIPGVGGVKVYRPWNGDIRPAELIPPEGTADWVKGVQVAEPIKHWLDQVYTAAADTKLTVGGTVKLVIADSTGGKPSSTLIELVQTTMDPTQNAGEGVGLAPIGHVVHVSGVEQETIDLTLTLTYQDGWTWEDAQAYVTNAIRAYFNEVAQTWAKQEQPLVLRISQIESRLLDIEGVLDVMDTQINGKAANYTLKPDHIPQLGTITPITSEDRKRYR